MRKINKQELKQYSEKLGIKPEELEKIIYTDKELKKRKSQLEKFQDEIKIINKVY